MTSKLKRQIRKVLKDYGSGHYTWNNAVDNISHFALSDGFFECLPSLSQEMVEDLKKLAFHAPSHPEDVLIIRSYCGPWPNPAWEKGMDDDRLRCYRSAKRLREFFFPDLPIPSFEPVRLIGKVEESVRLRESVVLFGEFAGWMIRKHPVYCITPSGDNVPIVVTSEGSVEHNHECSTDSFVRKHGRPALTVDGIDLRPEQIPASSEVWVDRTEATAIPSIASP